MKKITLSIFLIIICNFLNSQNNPSIRLIIGELVDNTPVFTVNTSALKIAYENALELEENSIEDLK